MASSALSVIFIGILCTAVATSSDTFGSGAPMSRIRVDAAHRYRDEFGRERVFHGFNRVQKSFPWYDPQLLNITRLKYYKQWGLNAARMGCMWTGVAPKQGFYNETYLNITMETVKRLADHGIYALLDMHQDVISSRYGSYDGVPRWVIDKLPNDTLPYPFPLTRGLIKESMDLGYLTMAVANAFQHLYFNSSGAWTHWGDFWVKVASTFKDQKSVIGYELINEPFAGNFYEKPSRLLPGVAGRENLLPAYDYLVSRIRAIDNETLVFYEPVTWGVVDSANSSLGTGFDRLPGGPSQRLRSVLSFHYYCWVMSLSNSKEPFPLWKKVLCKDIVMASVFPSVEKDIARTGGAAFLTEFGDCEPDGNSTSGNTEFCEEVLTEADKYRVSWTYWHSAFFKDDGNPNMNVVRAFARGYPRAIAGNLIGFSFDLKTAILRFTFNLNSTIAEPTEVFLPTQVHYPNGFTVSIQPVLPYTFNKADNVLLIQGYRASVPHDASISVQVEPKPKFSTRFHSRLMDKWDRL